MEQESVAQLRGQTYGFLRRVFAREVDAELLGWCREQAAGGLWDNLGVELNDLLDATDDEALLQDLAVEYCSLFILSGSSGSPHESVHVRRGGDESKPVLLMGDASSEAKWLYREAGFELSEDTPEMPDSLAVELEFMEHLCGQEHEAATAGKAKKADRCRGFQVRMLQEHLSQWVPTYARQIGEASRQAFYRNMALLLADFVEAELAAAEGGLASE